MVSEDYSIIQVHSRSQSFRGRTGTCGKVLVATKVLEQPFQCKLHTNSCSSTSIAAKTPPQYLSLRENFANGSVHSEVVFHPSFPNPLLLSGKMPFYDNSRR